MYERNAREERRNGSLYWSVWERLKENVLSLQLVVCHFREISPMKKKCIIKTATLDHQQENNPMAATNL